MRIAPRPVVLATVSLLAFPSTAAAAVETPVRITAKWNEFRPAVSQGYLAWTRVSRTKPLQYDVFASAPESTHRINPRTTDAYMGGIDGSRLIYSEQPPEGDSDLRLVDLTTRRRIRLPKSVNTKHDEFQPSIFGDHVSFGRRTRSGKGSFWVARLSTGETWQVESVGRAGLYPGQLQGDFVTWQTCAPKTCDVHRYTISTRTEVVAPNPTGLLHYSPGVASDGTVYFFRSGFGCGNEVFLMKWSGAGDATVVYDFPPTADTNNAFVYEGAGTREIHYSRYDCASKGHPTDLYKLTE